jgi:hypothetical protein
LEFTTKETAMRGVNPRGSYGFTEGHFDSETPVRGFKGNCDTGAVRNMYNGVAFTFGYRRCARLENEALLGETPSRITANHVGKFPRGVSDIMVQLSEILP